jgi:hypothetical protein
MQSGWKVPGFELDILEKNVKRTFHLLAAYVDATVVLLQQNLSMENRSFKSITFSILEIQKRSEEEANDAYDIRYDKQARC